MCCCARLIVLGLGFLGLITVGVRLLPFVLIIFVVWFIIGVVKTYRSNNRA